MQIRYEKAPERHTVLCKPNMKNQSRKMHSSTQIRIEKVVIKNMVQCQTNYTQESSHGKDGTVQQKSDIRKYSL